MLLFFRIYASGTFGLFLISIDLRFIDILPSSYLDRILWSDWFCAESCNDLFVLSEPVSVITGFRFNTCSTVPIYSKHYIFVQLGSVPFFFLDENVEGGGRFFRSADLFCRGPERGLRFNGRCLLFVPLDAAFLFFFAVRRVFKRLMF